MGIPTLLNCNRKPFFFKVLAHITLKCTCDQIFDFHSLHLRVQLDFIIHLGKCQSITNIRSHFILTFNSENLRQPLIKARLRMGESDAQYIPHGLEL